MKAKILAGLKKLWTKEQGARFIRLFASSLIAAIPTFAAAGQLKHFDWAPLGALLVGAAETAYRAWRPVLTLPPSS